MNWKNTMSRKKPILFNRSQLMPRMGLFIGSVDARVIALLVLIGFFRNVYVSVFAGAIALAIFISDLKGMPVNILIARVRALVAGKNRFVGNYKQRLSRYRNER